MVHGNIAAVNPQHTGTKAAAHYVWTIAAGPIGHRAPACSATPNRPSLSARPSTRHLHPSHRARPTTFYAAVTPRDLSDDARAVMRQAFAGMLWSKQYYHYVVRDWLNGDPNFPPPPPARRLGRNHEWIHLYNSDVISMPDKWEYPWYAAWDLAFHCLPLALIDSEFAKIQLVLMLREWYLHPNGQFPAYEWNFGDVNPPVHAWAAWRVYKIEQKRRGQRRPRLSGARLPQAAAQLHLVGEPQGRCRARTFSRAASWAWTTSASFNRSEPLPGGEYIEQADGTGWMAMYSLNLMAIALELARDDPAYEDVASKFWEHFLYIANAINHLGDDDARHVGRRGRLLLRRAAHARWPARAAQGALDGGADSAVRGRDAGAAPDGPPARLQAAACNGSSTTVPT